ncbi:MAG: 50S ribosomal protein L23 [Elusimicrobia bacterium RIFOXYC2_FULL_34_12]|nr:MAG: 50S ribosomal protein L23 [Elusimicrobia bacterium RIFOXYC2_FULL_34_12]OGS38587.1 MAG: 50S ribosomal protein L23 [Elusimicrobia bacterium RIFOXYD2_FULL_34_30]HAM38856.1 50S ribosomal protein L23 [Elusimicrobiota bacterium]
MLNAFNIIKKPLITEKATFLKEKEGKFVFLVDRKANKNQIKKAIKDLFNVDVVNVHTSMMSNKLRRVGVNIGYRTSYKKAIVKIKKGQTIKMVEGV